MIIDTPAVILRRFPYGETSIVARSYTKHHGKVSLIVKGARRKKSPMAAYFQPLNYLEIVYYSKTTRNLQSISKATFVKIWSNLNQDLRKITLGLAILELVEKTNTDYDPHPELFNLLITVLSAIDSSKIRLNLLFWYFQIKLLTILGFKPNFNELRHGSVIFPSPFNGPNSEDILNDLCNNSLDTITNRIATDQDSRAISDYLSAFYSYHFDGLENLKSFSVLKQIA